MIFRSTIACRSAIACCSTSAWSIFCFFLLIAAAQGAPPRWTWQQGHNYLNYHGNYGIKGRPASENWPGARSSSVTWNDAAGRLWIFGGGSPNGPSSRNDLWRYDPASGLWTWVKGSSERFIGGVYGQRGKPDPNNTPGARSGSSRWLGGDGMLWLFGGDGYDKDGKWGLLNGLWRFDPATGNWTWMTGSTQTDTPGVYGTRGKADPANTPGGRHGAATWTDAAGRLWLFGGEGFNAAGAWGYLNDLWRFDPATGLWTWMGGSTAVFAPGVFGTQGVAAPANTPGGRAFAAAWTDLQGRFWLWGGTDGPNFFNDLWRFDPLAGDWAWIKGSKAPNARSNGNRGEPEHETSTPGARAFTTAWRDATGRLWLFGGQGLGNAARCNYFNELWRFDPASGNWAWLTGDLGISEETDEIQEPAPGEPEARWSASGWRDSNGMLWLYGGKKENNRNSWDRLNDLWRLDPVKLTWTWVKGKNIDRKGIYGTQGIAAAGNTPGARWGAATWVDPAGRMWLLGGEGHDQKDYTGLLNDLWRFDPQQRSWVWVKGDSYAGALGAYAQQGIPSDYVKPGVRRNSTTWCDRQGRLWLFGGFCGGDHTRAEAISDLWCFDPEAGMWTWVKGWYSSNSPGEYGTQGVANELNNPGARSEAAGWVDQGGRLWLFGGEGMDGAGQWGALGDLFRFDPVARTWTWIKGSAQAGAPGKYGWQGLGSAGNTPGARRGAATWTDASGRFWLFGGAGVDGTGHQGLLNDLWRLDPATGRWAWIKGSKAANPRGTYGALGEETPAVIPGGRHSMTCWIDQLGRFCLFGGVGLDHDGRMGALGDLWRYDPRTGNWTWVRGSENRNEPGYYGTQGVAADWNTPGARRCAAAWAGRTGEVWLFGGAGAVPVGNSKSLLDLWHLTAASAAECMWEKLE